MDRWEVCIKLIKHMLKKCINTKLDIHRTLLQIRSTPLGPGLPSSAMLLFSHLERHIMPIISRPLVNSNNDDEHYEVLVKNKE